MQAQNEIDVLVLEIFGTEKIFVEAGGSHPIDQNNTYLLEKNGWYGLIVEPKEDFNLLYSQIRPKTLVENYVLVSRDYDDIQIEGDFSHYMVGGIVNTWNNTWNPKKHRCCTLDHLLKKNNINEIHFLSLDVEGYELEVLGGLDLETTFVHLMVLEVHEVDGKYINFDYLAEKGFVKILVLEGYRHEFWMNKKSDFFKTNSSE